MIVFSFLFSLCLFIIGYSARKIHLADMEEQQQIERAFQERMRYFRENW